MSRRGGWIDPFAGMPGRRLFIAVPLPADAVAAVSEIVEAVRARPLPAGMRDVRWVRLDGLHLTLRFLGPTPEARIPPTVEAMAAVAAAHGPLEGRLAGTGTFPAGGKPRTLWVGMVEGGDGLAAMAGDLDDALRTAGWPGEGRAFRPHLTLARSDGLAAGPTVAARLGAAFGTRAIPFSIDRMGLFESVTGGGPARYVPVTELPLAGMH